MDKNYVTDSLEQHLFFARIMKEHALFLKTGFLPCNASLAREGEHFLRQFESLLARAIGLSNCVVSQCVLDSGELVTQFTDCAEMQTQRLTGTSINRELTARTMAMQGRDAQSNLCVPQMLACQIRQLNRDGLMLVNGFINYKERLLCAVRSCKLFTANYPLLIAHILREAQLYRKHLLRLEGMEDCTSPEIYDGEPFWNHIMMEHALFIRGLLDPSEETLIHTADDFAADYRQLLDGAAVTQEKTMCGMDALALTKKFREFKQAGTEGLEACQIQGLILPLLADHVLREANHYIRLLEKNV